MCGSVKTSRSVGKSQLSFDNELSDEQRLRFVAKANMAQIRRAEREAVNKKWVAKQKEKKPKQFSFFSWLKRFF